MAIELFKPFIYNKLEERGYVNTIKSAKKMVEKERPEVWDILEEVITEHPVLLNRAPTLHRLGIQAFEPVLIEGKAIQLHPLVCAAFNADFDGDQMAVHVPLSVEAQMEARVLMMSTNNILSPANGRPIINPTQDIVLGLYYATRERKFSKGCFREGALSVDKKGHAEGYLRGVFSSVDEVRMAYDHGEVTLHSGIRVRVARTPSGKIADPSTTTVGRCLIAEILPEGLPFDLRQQDARQEGASAPSSTPATACTATRRRFCLADRLRSLGFDYATRAGVSICMDHMVIPQAKEVLLGEAQAEVQRVIDQYQEGLITDGERYNKIVDIWAGVADKVTQEMMDGDRQGEDRRRRDGQGAHRAELQPHLHHGRLGRARLDAADPAARRHARPDGEAVGRDHRDARSPRTSARGSRCSSTSSRRTARARASPTRRSRRPTPGTSPGASSTSRRTRSSPSSTAGRSTASA